MCFIICYTFLKIYELEKQYCFKFVITPSINTYIYLLLSLIIILHSLVFFVVKYYQLILHFNIFYT